VPVWIPRIAPSEHLCRQKAEVWCVGHARQAAPGVLVELAEAVAARDGAEAAPLVSIARLVLQCVAGALAVASSSPQANAVVVADEAVRALLEPPTSQRAPPTAAAAVEKLLTLAPRALLTACVEPDGVAEATAAAAVWTRVRGHTTTTLNSERWPFFLQTNHTQIRLLFGHIWMFG
jgi:hypothetical protein